MGKDHSIQRAQVPWETDVIWGDNLQIRSLRTRAWSGSHTEKVECPLPAISAFGGHPYHTEKSWGNYWARGTFSSLRQHFILSVKALWSIQVTEHSWCWWESIYAYIRTLQSLSKMPRKAHKETGHCTSLWRHKRDWRVIKRNFYYLFQMLLPGLIIFSTTKTYWFWIFLN